VVAGPSSSSRVPGVAVGLVGRALFALVLTVGLDVPELLRVDAGRHWDELVVVVGDRRALAALARSLVGGALAWLAAAGDVSLGLGPAPS
jgi:hypothetical protein